MKKRFEFLLIFICIITLFSVGFSVIKKIKSSDPSESNDPNSDLTESVDPEESKDPSTDSIIDFSKLTYISFGDSITAGTGLESSTFSYPNVTAQSLGCNVVNRGRAGSTLAKEPGTERVCIADEVNWRTANGEKYNIISVSGGSNDKSLSLKLGTIDDNSAFSK